MKSFITLAVLFITTTTIAQTQSSWHYGLKAGLDFTGIDGNGMRGKMGIGVLGGVFVEKAFSSKWSLQPEVQISQFNVKRANDFMKYYNVDGRSDASPNAKLSYIDIPVLIKYNINETFSVLAGPQYSLRVFEDENLLEGDRDAFKKSNFSANVGVQATFSSVSFYARYNQGLVDINNIDERYKWTSNQLQLGIAVKIK